MKASVNSNVDLLKPNESPNVPDKKNISKKTE